MTQFLVECITKNLSFCLCLLWHRRYSHARLRLFNSRSSQRLATLASEVCQTHSFSELLSVRTERVCVCVCESCGWHYTLSCRPRIVGTLAFNVSSETNGFIVINNLCCVYVVFKPLRPQQQLWREQKHTDCPVFKPVKEVLLKLVFSILASTRVVSMVQQLSYCLCANTHTIKNSKQE